VRCPRESEEGTRGGGKQSRGDGVGWVGDQTTNPVVLDEKKEKYMRGVNVERQMGFGVLLRKREGGLLL